MKRRASRSRHILRKLATATCILAIVVASAWYLAPVATTWLHNDTRFDRRVVTIDDVNLRTGPGTSWDVVAVIPQGTELSADSETVDGFVAVAVDGQSGWMASDFLMVPGAVAAAEHEVASADTTSAASTSASTTVSVAEQPAPTAPAIPTPLPTTIPVAASSTEVEAELQPGEKWIEVDRTLRTVTLHDGEITVASFDALIGKDLSADGYFSTAVGTYYVHVKEKSLAETPFADGVYLTDFVGFDPDRSNGFHSPTRDQFGNVVVTGGTATLGCVRLSETNAIVLFDFSYIGMRVEIHD